MKPARHFVIGDVHGHYSALSAVIASLKLNRKDRVTFLGDLIDHGDRSKEVIDLVISLMDRCKVDVIMGNHEAYLLASIENREVLPYWERYGARKTLDSFGVTHSNEIDDHYLSFFRTLPKYIETDTHIFCHAGVKSEFPMSLQDDDSLLWNHMDQKKAHISGKTVIHGHTPQTKFSPRGHFINLDTGIASGGMLSCYEIHTHNLYQSNSRGQIRKRIFC